MRCLPLVTIVALGEIFLAKPCNAQFYGGYAPQPSVNQYTGFGGAPNYGGAPAQNYAPQQNVNPYPQNYSGAPAQNYAPQQYPQNYGRAPAQNYAPPQNVNRYTGFGGTPVQSYAPPAQYYNAQPRPVQATPQRMPAQYQQEPSTMQNLERALNQVDTNNAWARTPAVTAQPARTAYATPQAGYKQPGYASAQQQQVGMMPRITRRDIARVFMQGGSLWGGGGGGGAGAAAPSAGSAQATSNAYSYYQKAENMAIRARNAANRTLSGDKWSKSSYADEAYYDANDAESAANSAYDAAQSGDSQARNYAGLARDASERARADSNRARYNADTAR